MNRKLHLKRETLTELSTQEMHGVVGAKLATTVGSNITECLALTCGCITGGCLASVDSCYPTCGCETA